MSRKLIHALVTAAALTLLAAQAAPAAPMKCSGEQKACATACQKTVNPALLAQCIADCQTRQKYCRQTGCWDNGISRYCGLLRQ
jgi:hypothetical protein